MRIVLGAVITCLVFITPSSMPGFTVDARDLQNGMRGSDVRALQELLVDLGYDLTVDGIFGRKTEALVKQIQQQAGIVPDGIVGAKTNEILTLLKERVVSYTVKSGDNLTKLANQYGTTVSQIADFNALPNPDRLLPGQQILIPTSSLAVVSSGLMYRQMFSWPVKGSISSGYGWRIHPITKVRHFHGGIDIAAPQGTAVRAGAGGKVIRAGRMGNYGLGIVIDHGNGYTSWYGHNSKLLVRVGDLVQRGQTIAQVGSTGLATGPHLDFRIKIKDQTVDPLEWLP